MLIRVMAVVILLSFACQHDVAKKTTPIIHINNFTFKKKRGGGKMGNGTCMMHWIRTS